MHTSLSEDSYSQTVFHLRERKFFRVGGYSRVVRKEIYLPESLDQNSIYLEIMYPENTNENNIKQNFTNLENTNKNCKEREFSNKENNKEINTNLEFTDQL